MQWKTVRTAQITAYQNLDSLLYFYTFYKKDNYAVWLIIKFGLKIAYGSAVNIIIRNASS